MRTDLTDPKMEENIDKVDLKAEMLRKLEFLKSSLDYNWNGEDDLPLEEKAYSNTKKAIENTSESLLKHWRLFPAPNGTLLLSPKGSHLAGISIGNQEFSYAAFLSDDKQIKGQEHFDIESFKDALKRIHDLLGLVDQ